MSEKLHCYSNDVDTVVAESVDAALVLWCEHTGNRHNEADPFEQVPDEKLIKITDEYEETGERTAAEWAAHNGRGFLCSTEW